MANKKRADSFFQKKVSNRLAYTIISVIALALVSFVVYAQTVSNPGHPITQISEPLGCLPGQFLQWTTSGWRCGDGGGISGTGITGYMTKWIGTNSLGSGTIFNDPTTGWLSIRNTTYGGQIIVDPAASSNSYTSRIISEFPLSIRTYPSRNIVLDPGAGTGPSGSGNADVLVNGDLIVSGTIQGTIPISGYLNNCVKRSAFASSVNCQAGEIAVGGGGVCSGFSSAVQQSYPMDNLAGWVYACANSAPTSSTHAVCCRI